MISISALDNLMNADKPRRVMKYVLVYCASGSLLMTIDEKKFKLSAGQAKSILQIF